ncbi:MAG: helix-turn-helix transcriptional regulator [Spirochaetales bacterium]|nr:helix-turn-helix transcriptional regulator [Spirochaetales bacterium]
MAIMTISEKIRALRKEKGLKQEQLAEICDVSVEAVGTWERGKKIPEFDNLIKLANTFDVSLDVFRQDAPTLNVPHPHFADNHDRYNNAVCYNGTPLRFGSTEPDAKQQSILDFCGFVLDSLDERYFIKGVGQNSEFGTGRYFWESRIDYLMWIGFTPTLDGADCRYAYSVAINTETPLPSNLLAAFDCLQVTDSDEENWIYVPIDLDETDSDRMLHNAKRSLKTAIEISRLALNVMTMEVTEAIRN